MAIIVKETELCTFIHIPKTGGISVHTWLFDNFNAAMTKGNRHCNAKFAEQHFGDLGFAYCTVRNPYDWCVSWYYFSIERAHRRISYIENSDRPLANKKKYNKEFQKKELRKLEKGFDYWLTECFNTPCQSDMAAGVEYVMKLENLNKDFELIQKKLNCYVPLLHLNTSNRSDYRDYYTPELRKVVEQKYKEDLDRFNYTF